jgi:phage-related tail protein
VPGDATTERSLTGPLAPPGTYQVQLSVGGQTYTASFEIRKDPRVSATPADFESQFSLLIRIRDKLSETHDAITRLRSIRQQVEEWAHRAEGMSNGQTARQAVGQAATVITEKLTAIEAELIQSRARVQQDQLNFPTRLNAKLSGLSSVVGSADGAPTQQAYDVFRELSARIDQQLIQLQEVIDADVAAFNELVHTSAIPAIVVGPTP